MAITETGSSRSVVRPFGRDELTGQRVGRGWTRERLVDEAGMVIRGAPKGVLCRPNDYPCARPEKSFD